MMDSFLAPMEIKLAAGDNAGEIEGYGAVFGNMDSHGDVILPGAFGGVLAQHKAAGTMPTMYVEHGPALGGSMLPDGVWDEMAEDAQGLRVKGRILALDTDHGKRIRSLAAAGALKGLSIGYHVGSGNAVFGKGAGQPKRQIKAFDKLFEVSLVTSPSNGRAQIDSIKAMMGLADKDKATAAVMSALKLHGSSMAGGDSPTKDERAQMLSHLQDAHEALTGKRMPDGMKMTPRSAAELKTALLDLGYSDGEAERIANATHPSPAQQPADFKADLSFLDAFKLTA